MGNITDDIRQHFDTFAELPFTEADSLALSQLAYARMPDNVPRYHENAETADGMIATVPIHDLLRAECYDDMFGKVWSPSMNVDLLRAMSESPRWRNLRVGAYVDEFDAATTKQFSACVFELGNGTLYVAFRGTDSSIIGWNEDMNMNYMPKVYGQDVAANYLKEIAAKYPDDKIYLAGHSKGGNYAEYALSVAEPALQDRVIKAFSFDGPGFFHQVWRSPGFVRALPKMKTYLPEASIIGTMLDHPERVIIVKSNAPMIQQHDPRRWSVGRDSFVLAEGLTSGSRSLKHSLIDFNHTIPDKQRGELWDTLFQTFNELNITDVFQITANKLLGTVRFSRVIMALTPETRKYVLHMIGEILNAIRGNISLPFNETDFALYPKSNDSNKAPIFFEFYDKTVPSLLPEEIKQRFKDDKERERENK